MPLLLADFIYSRDCKPNLRKNVDTTRIVDAHLHKLIAGTAVLDATSSSFASMVSGSRTNKFVLNLSCLIPLICQ